MPGFTADDYIENMVKPKLAEHGWMAQGVLASEDVPAYMYTVGMTPAGLPELLIVGLPNDMMHDILHRAVKLHNGTGINDGDEVDIGFSVKFRATAVGGATAGRLLGVANRVFPDRTKSALQLMYPDAAGRWPGEEGCDFNDRVITAFQVLAASDVAAAHRAAQQ